MIEKALQNAQCYKRTKRIHSIAKIRYVDKFIPKNIIHILNMANRKMAEPILTQRKFYTKGKYND